MNVLSRLTHSPRQLQALARVLAAICVLSVTFVVGCQPPTEEPTPGETPLAPLPTPAVTPIATPAATPTVAPPITLNARRAIIEYSPRPQPPPSPPSLDDVVAPPAGSWQLVAPDTTIPFNSYDSLRVVEAGEALLDLGGLMQLLFKRDTVMQSTDPGLAAEAYGDLEVGTGDSPPLQALVLNVHLFRGGFSGKLEFNGRPIALSTPNAVIIVSGTQFFVAYDPDAGRTWVANFDGTIHVGGLPLPPGGLGDHTLAVIPPLNGRALWDIPPGLTMEEFGRLVDETGSPLAAAALLSGPTLLPLGSAGLAVLDAPAPDAARLSVLPRARIVALRRGATGPEGEPYWEVACPAGIPAPPRGCWVRGGLGLATVYNAGGLPPDEVPSPEPPVAPPTPAPTPIPDSDGDGWLDPADFCPGRSAWPNPNPFQPGCPAPVIPPSPTLIPTPTPTLPPCPSSPAEVGPEGLPAHCPDADGDLWWDGVDRCVSEPAGDNPDPKNPGCPLDLCPDVPEGAIADPERPGCPLDSDGDGWIDEVDECDQEPPGNYPDPDRLGCPLALDYDRDGVPDPEDVCPDVPAGPYPDKSAQRRGCPRDRDGDLIIDQEDVCPNIPAGRIPDDVPRLGCPRDSDGDGWIDEVDQCIDVPAGLDPDPDRPGCPAIILN